MFRHYIKTALREFKGNPVYNIISVVCLAVGTLIFAVLEYDLDNDMLFDRRLPWNDRIVEAVYVEHFDDGRPDTIAPFEILEQHHFETSGIELVSGSSFDRKYGEAYEEGITAHAEMVLTDPEGSSVAVTGSFDNVMSGYYKTRGLTLLYGDRVPMNRREIIVKESLLKRLSLNGDIGGYVLEPSAPDGSIIHGTECRIVNVIKDDKWSRRIKADIFMFDQDNRKVYAVLAQGVDMDMANRMLESNSFTRGPRMLTPQVRALEPPMQDRSYIWKRLLSVLALIIGTICYLGNLVSSFSRRWAGNRLRLCLGSTRLGLGWMLICRILTTLFPAAVLAVVSALLLIPLLNSLDTVVVYYHLPYVIMLEVAVTVAVLLLCSIVVIAVIRYAGVSVTDRQNGLSHRERNILKYALLSVEIALSVMALGGSLSMIATMPRPYCPLSRHELSRILTLDMRNGAFGQSRDIITQKVKAIPDVEEVLVTEKPLHPEGRGFDQARVEQFRWFDEFAGYWSYSRYPQFICADSNYLSFFRIPVEQVLNDRSGQSVYVSESLWQSMADSIRGELDIRVVNDWMPEMAPILPYRVAGVFPNPMGAPDEYEDYLLGPINEMHPGQYLFIKFRKGTDMKEMRSLIEDICEVETGNMNSGNIGTMGGKWLGTSRDARLTMAMLLSAALAGMLMVLFSIISIISADTVARRKEVALRKIHGAKSGDIARLFMLPYLWVLIISFCMGYPCSRFLPGLADEPILTWRLPATLLITAVVIILTAIRRLRKIMHTNPADVIKND